MAQEIRPTVIRPPGLRALAGQKQFSGSALAAAVARGDEAVLARAEDGSVAVAVAHRGEVAIAVAENRSTAFASSWQGGSALALASGEAEATAQAFGASDALASARRVFGEQQELLLSLWVPPDGEAAAIAGGRVGTLVDCLAVGPEGFEPSALEGAEAGREGGGEGVGRETPGGKGGKGASPKGASSPPRRPLYVTRRRVHPADPGEAGGWPAVSAIVREMEEILQKFETSPNREAAIELKATVALILAAVTA